MRATKAGEDVSLPVRGKRPTLSDVKYDDGEQTVLENLRPLTQEQRQDARHAAHDAVIRAVGARPERDQFMHHATSKYPPMVTRLINVYYALCYCWPRLPLPLSVST